MKVLSALKMASMHARRQPFNAEVTPSVATEKVFSLRVERGFIHPLQRFTLSFFKPILGYIQKFPALLALLTQLLSALFVLASCWLFVNITAYFSFPIFSVPVLLAVFMQAIVASSISSLLSMASWWRWIHFCFPLVVWAMLMINVPNEVYLAGFLVTLSIFWTTFRTQVPYYPSRRHVWQQVSVMTHQFKAQQQKKIRLIDIGSGLGGLSLHLAKEHADATIEGIEIAPLPWFASRLTALYTRSAAYFRLGNYHALNFADYDIIFAYLSPAAMLDLWEKSRQEMRVGSLLISLEFEIPNILPTQHIVGDGQSPDLYVYQFS
jgi:hypothetical protein